MVLRRLLEKSPKRGTLHKEIKETKALSYIECLENAFFQISSVINARKDLKAIFEVIVQESLYCLKAHRSTIFLLDEKSGILKIECTHVSDPPYEQIGLNEEREVAQKTLKNNKPFLLGGQENSSDFFKHQKQGRKVTSLMSIPFSSNGKPIGVLSVVMINEESGFDEKSLQFFSSFANLASTAMEMVRLLEEVHEARNFRITHERYLDNILNQLQTLSEKDQRPIDSRKEDQRIDSDIEKIQAETKIEEEKFQDDQTEEKVPWVQGTITLKKESGIDRRKDERVEIFVRVEFHEEYWGFTQNLSKGGAFILTPDPMELGDEFLLKLHMPDAGEPIELSCKVVWTNKYGKETEDLRRGMGIKFLRLQHEVQKRIEAYIQSQRNRRLRLEN